MTNRVKMTVTMEVTESQALALQAMFKYWNWLASVGSSRQVAFFVDGDGNFKPKCDISFDNPVQELTDELEKLAVARDNSGDRLYDFDHIAWTLRKSK